MSLYLMIVKKRLKAKIQKNFQVDVEKQRESEVISNNILERMEISKVYTDPKCYEEKFDYNTSIFNIFK